MRAHTHVCSSPDLLLSTIFRAAVTNQCDHLSPVRALEDNFDICAIGIRQAEPEHVQVVLRVFRNAETRAFEVGRERDRNTRLNRFSKVRIEHHQRMRREERKHMKKKKMEVEWGRGFRRTDKNGANERVVEDPSDGDVGDAHTAMAVADSS